MSTPHIYPSLSHATESDLRSTTNDYMPPHPVEARSGVQSEAEKSPDDSAESDEEESSDHVSKDTTQYAICPTWTPINEPSMRPRKLPLDLAAFSLRNGYSLTNVELRMNEIFNDEEELVDKKDGLVYHQGHKYQNDDGQGSSYSFVWLDDDPNLLPGHVQQWKNDQTQKQRNMEGPVLEKDVRHMLETGSALIVERTGPQTRNAGTYGCLLTECPYEGQCFPPGHFYIALRPGRYAWPLPRPFCFCLPCFERLWKGEFSKNLGPGPAGVKVAPDVDTDSNAEPHTTSSPSNAHGCESPRRFDTPFSYPMELTLDGEMQSAGMSPAPRMSSLCSSRHAPPQMASSPLLDAVEEAEYTVDDSPSSINSQGDWIAQLDRVQHIAAFFKPGTSLDEIETATVRLWKLASFEQLQWAKHMQKTHYTRDYQAGDSLIDNSLNMEQFQIEDVDDEQFDESALEVIVKLPKKRFRGCSLADVWMVMRKECEDFA